VNQDRAPETLTVSQEQEATVALAPVASPAPLLPTEEFPGIDMDAIHYKRGAVRRSALNRRTK
jgi:hypothetical protein